MNVHGDTEVPQRDAEDTGGLGHGRSPGSPGTKTVTRRSLDLDLDGRKEAAIVQGNRIDDHRLATVDRMIEGRMELIDRLFEDVRELSEERARIAGRRVGFFSRLFDRRPRGR